MQKTIKYESTRKTNGSGSQSPLFDLFQFAENCTLCCLTYFALWKKKEEAFFATVKLRALVCFCRLFGPLLCIAFFCFSFPSNGRKFFPCCLVGHAWKGVGGGLWRDTFFKFNFLFIQKFSNINKNCNHKGLYFHVLSLIYF